MPETTPPPQPQPPKYTPGNQGSATVSEYVEKYTFTLPSVNPWIHRDVKSHQTCKFETMLKALLKRCLSDNDTSDLDELLNDCLEDVLPLCNDDNELRAHLSEYCRQVSSERGRYAPFVGLCNYALDVLGSKDWPKFRHSATVNDSERVLFHVSDSSVIGCSHGQRKPDVLLVPFKAAQKSARDNHQSDPWEDVIMKTATSPPHKAFSWENTLLPLEFKLMNRTLKSPPKNYRIKAPKSIIPIRTPSDGLSDTRISTSSAILTTETFSGRGASVEQATTSARKRPTRSESIPSKSSNKSKKSNEGASGSNGGGNRRSSRLVKEKKTPSGGQHSEGTGTKRPAETGTTESKKRQRTDEPRVTLHVNIQTAMYGAEILSHSPFSTSAMAMVVIDSVLYLWWYDRQGAIQTYGLDFIEDLPHFLVLLLALQCLPPKGWGKVDALESPLRIKGQYGEMEIKLGERLVRHWGIQGRATNILEVKPECFPPCIPSKLKEQLECQGMVGKLLWVQSKRVLESEILEEIPKRMVGIPEEDQAAVKGHIPDLIASKTFPECETRKIREDLGIDVEDIENRVLILSIFRKLKPITELEYDDFWRAWWDCVLCHLVLWTIGIRHRDISAGNLMYYRHRGRVMGVLNDYDLSTLIRPGYEEGPTGTDRTGTVPFMALDLLESSALAGNVEHQYQHDFEAFLWVLTWITHRYQEGRMMSHAPFNAWIADHQQCRKEKSTYQADLVKNKQPLPPPTSSHESVWWKCGKILLRMSFLVSVNDENLPEARDYFNRMKKGIEESGKDLTVNSLDEL